MYEIDGSQYTISLASLLSSWMRWRSTVLEAQDLCYFWYVISKECTHLGFVNSNQMFIFRCPFLIQLTSESLFCLLCRDDRWSLLFSVEACTARSPCCGRWFCANHLHWFPFQSISCFWDAYFSLLRALLEARSSSGLCGMICFPPVWWYLPDNVRLDSWMGMLPKDFVSRNFSCDPVYPVIQLQDFGRGSHGGQGISFSTCVYINGMRINPFAEYNSVVMESK